MVVVVWCQVVSRVNGRNKIAWSAERNAVFVNKGKKLILTCLVFLNLRACECGLYRRCCSKSLARLVTFGEQVEDSTIEYLLLWWY